MLATPIPEMLRETMDDFGASAVEGWWADLDESARGQVIQLWRETAFDQAQPCEAYVSARLVQDGQEEDDGELWNRDFYEYLVNHEAFSLAMRPFHLCTLHPKARDAVACGFIPGDFACPLEHADCPMRRLLRAVPGASIRLRIAFASHGVVSESRLENR